MSAHSKEVMERRRQGFERHCLQQGHTAYELDIVRGSYRAPVIRYMWETWNSALDSIEIELPAAWSASMLDSDQALQDCRYAIESTGLGLRVKA